MSEEWEQPPMQAWAPPAPPPAPPSTPPPPPPAWGAPAAGPPPPPPPWASRRVSAEPLGRSPSLRALYGGFALGVILAIGLLGGVVGQIAAEERHDWDPSGSWFGDTSRLAEESACETEMRTLTRSLAAYRAAHQEFGGIYTDEAGLIAEGRLQRESSNYDIVLGSPPTTYQIVSQPDSDCD